MGACVGGCMHMFMDGCVNACLCIIILMCLFLSEQVTVSILQNTKLKHHFPKHFCSTYIQVINFFLIQFSYATCLDKFLIFTGTLAAAAVGAGFPLMAIVLGGMTNDFISGKNTIHENSCTLSLLLTFHI